MVIVSYSGGWSSWAPTWMCGPAIKGSTVGMVGFGRIGQEVTRKLKVFHVGKILYTDSSKHPKTEGNLEETLESRVLMLKMSLGKIICLFTIRV